MTWWWLAGVPVAVVAVDRLGLWAEEQGWVYWRRRKPGGAGGGAFNELIELFEPGYRHQTEEQEWRRYATTQRVAGAPDVDLDAGTATLPGAGRLPTGGQPAPSPDRTPDGRMTP